jgi:outer membrane protein assembly factor BamB
LRKDFGGKPGMWAYAESVLIDGNTLVCTPGGDKATLVALDKKSGATIWQSQVPDGDNAEYASIMIVGNDSKKQYVQFLRRGLVGVDARSGKFLWRYDRTIDPGANIMTPIVAGLTVFSAGSRGGGGLIELKVNGDAVSPAELYFDREIAPSIGGAVVVDGFLYGTGAQTLFCADFKSGKVQWTNRSVGAASLCYADRRIYVRGHKGGEVALVEPSPIEYREKGRFTQPDRSEINAWPHPVIANGGLYLRDQQNLFCYDIAVR